MKLMTITLGLALCAGLAGAQDGLPHDSQPRARGVGGAAASEDPVDDSAGQPGKRSGVVGANRKKRTSIENRNELDRFELIPDGYAYDVEGTYSEHYLEVSALTLTAPDGSRTIRLKRVEVASPVSRIAAGLSATVNGTERSLRENPFSRLEELLSSELTARGAGNFVLRGWAIDIETACGIERSLLLDGIQAVTPEGSGWAIGHYNRNGKPNRPRVVVDTGDGMQYGVKQDKATLIRLQLESAQGLSGAVRND